MTTLKIATCKKCDGSEFYFSNVKVTGLFPGSATRKQTMTLRRWICNKCHTLHTIADLSAPNRKKLEITLGKTQSSSPPPEGSVPEEGIK
jgi:hypothetical protein